MSRLISFAVLIAIIIVIGLLFYRVLIGFFIPLFLAAVLVVIFRPLHRWVLEKTGHRDQLAAVLTTVLIVLIIFLPIVVVGSAAATQGLRIIQVNDAATIGLRLVKMRETLGLEMPAYQNSLRDAEIEINKIVEYSSGSILLEEDPKLVGLGKQTLETLDELQKQVEADSGNDRWQTQFARLKELTEQIGKPMGEQEGAVLQPAIELKTAFGDLKTQLLGGSFMALAKEKANPDPEEIEQLLASVIHFVQPRLLSITGATGTFMVKLVIGFVILIVATFFFLYDGPGMLKTVMNLSPLDDAYEQELLMEFDRISRAVVLATLLSAVVQGLTAGLGFAVAGMNFLALLIMLTTFFAMIPFVGPAVVWIPVCLYIGIYEERYTAAILLALWGVLVVGTVDNLVKAFVLHGQSQMHPLLALLSVLGGVQALGPVGIVVGPMVVAMLQTLLSILQRELVQFDKQNLVVSTQGLASADPQPRRSKRSRRQRKPLAAQEQTEDGDSQPAAPAPEAGGDDEPRSGNSD